MKSKSIILCVLSIALVAAVFVPKFLKGRTSNQAPITLNDTSVPAANAVADTSDSSQITEPTQAATALPDVIKPFIPPQSSTTPNTSRTPDRNPGNHKPAVTKAPQSKQTTAPNTPSNNSQVNYSATGSYSTTSVSESDYTIFYPKNIASESKRFPLITWGNGMGTTPKVYSRLINHIVSHGFVVVASNSSYVGSGAEMVAAIDYMVTQSKDSKSKFYNKIDLSNIGATGHSLGGRGTLNTASKDSRVKCIVPIQPAGADNISKVTCPTFFITSTNDTTLPSDTYVKPLFESISAKAVYASLSGEPHTAPATCTNKLQGYVTAWLSIYLKSDSSALSYFKGDSSTIKNDSNWTDIRTKNI